MEGQQALERDRKGVLASKVTPVCIKVVFINLWPTNNRDKESFVALLQMIL